MPRGKDRPPAGYGPAALPWEIPASVRRGTAWMLAGALTGCGVHVHLRRGRRAWEVYVPVRYAPAGAAP